MLKPFQYQRGVQILWEYGKKLPPDIFLQWKYFREYFFKFIQIFSTVCLQKFVLLWKYLRENLFKYFQFFAFKGLFCNENIWERKFIQIFSTVCLRTFFAVKMAFAGGFWQMGAANHNVQCWLPTCRRFNLQHKSGVLSRKYYDLLFLCRLNRDFLYKLWQFWAQSKGLRLPCYNKSK